MAEDARFWWASVATCKRLELLNRFTIDVVCARTGVFLFIIVDHRDSSLRSEWNKSARGIEKRREEKNYRSMTRMLAQSY
jgi:hypothetical protein